MSPRIVQKSTKLFAISAMLICLSGCETLLGTVPPPPAEIVVQTDCSWAKKITLSDETFGFIAENIETETVRRDAEQILAHNESFEKFCG